MLKKLYKKTNNTVKLNFINAYGKKLQKDRCYNRNNSQLNE